VKYVAEYRAKVFVYIDTEAPEPYKISRVAVDDEGVGEPVHIESDNGDRVFYSRGFYDSATEPPQSEEDAKHAAAVLDVVESEEWPAWEFGV